MPKVKPLTSRPEWERRLLIEIGGAQAQTGKNYKEICKIAGLKYETFIKHLHSPGMMRHGESGTFLETCQKIIGEKL